MSTLMRRGTVAALVLAGLLASHGVARAQFAYGNTRFGLNTNNPFVAQMQFVSNLRANQLAIRAGAQVPAWLPYVAPYAGAPAYYPPYAGSPVAPLANPYVGYGAYGANPYTPYGGGGVLTRTPIRPREPTTPGRTRTRVRHWATVRTRTRRSGQVTP